MDHEYFPYYFTEQAPRERGLLKEIHEAVLNLSHRLAEAFNPSPIL